MNRMLRRPAVSFVLVVALAWFAGATTAFGQAETAPEPDPAETESGRRFQLLTNFDYHFAIAHLGSDDEQFVWDADYGGNIDLLDYGTGRVKLLANYEAILGELPRRIDPNQGNYTLDLSTSWRVTDDLEAAVVFHHISRHLGDRPKIFAIDWNMLGIQVERPVVVGATAVELHGRALWTLKRAFTDYRAEYGGGARLRHPIHPRVAVIGAGEVTVVPVDPRVIGRSTQTGGALEAGIRIEGPRAAAEFFIAVERRIDASAFDVHTRTWGLFGLRLLSR